MVGDKRFRIWQIYLAGCAYGFAKAWMNVYQVPGCKAENAGANPLPLTREYVYDPIRREIVGAGRRKIPEARGRISARRAFREASDRIPV